MRLRTIVLCGLLIGLAAGCGAERDGSYVKSVVAAHKGRANGGAVDGARLVSALYWMAGDQGVPERDKPVAKDAEKAPKPTAEKIWALLNSSFGLWVLSSVVLAWITKAYSTMESRKAENLKRSTTKQRLDTEIAIRLAMSLDGLRLYEAAAKGQPTKPQNIYIDAYNSLENFFIHNPNNPRDYSVYPEYRERTFRALILELRSVVESREIEDLKEALDAFEDLSDGSGTYQGEATAEGCLKAFEEVQKLLRDRLLQERWKPMVDFLVARENRAEVQS